MILTLCPHCGTRFRVTPGQLRARKGRVRCGRCGTAFDAVEGIGKALSAAPVRDAGPAANPPSAPERNDSPLGPETGSADAGKVSREGALPGTPAESEAAGADVPTPSAGQPAIEVDAGEPPGMRPRSSWHARAWSVATAVLLAAAAAQLAYLFRSELAVAMPSVKPWLEQGCALLDCDVGLPRRAELLSVEASDLRPHGSVKGQLALSATLRNRAPFAMEYPHLELTLTDTADRALARRVFSPREYLVAGENPSAGLPPQTDFQLGLAIEAASLEAAGYRLYVFYP